jgi:tetratricopeptide (TPR) repeat protein
MASRLFPAVLRPATSLIVPVLIVLAACAHQAPESAPLPADQLRALEQRFGQDSSNVSLRIRLATAYRTADRQEDARRLLEPAVRTDPLVAYHLALVNEELNRWSAARTLYQDYLQRGRNSELQQTVRNRLLLVQRHELEEAVRGALARERELTGTTPPARTVGVFPYLTITTDTSLHALGTALAELLTIDLAQTDRLRVLERVQVQLLLDELKLGASERVNAATAARSGRLLGASNIVQGRLEGSNAQLSLQTSVVRVPAPSGNAPAPLRAGGALARIFEIEKNLALGLYERMGVQLTPAERQRVLRQQTQNVQALIAFGYGLEAADAGHYSDAYTHFQRALQLDPGFTRARDRMDESSRLGLAASLSVDALATLAQPSEPAPSAAAATRTTPGGRPATSAAAIRLQRLLEFRTIEQLMITPLTRDPAAEVAGTEGATRSGQAELVIRRPGGTQ